MQFAENGAALIGNTIVPASEVKVLRALAAFDRPATVPEIAKALKGELSDASIYSLLGRLAEKRRLVDRKDVQVVVPETTTTLRRVLWRALPPATLALNAYEAFTKEERSARATA
ncbi:MarR family transcriptional regulator [Ideonella sp. B508-1]|uniref:MarR family transcriptional regulator n=1 Tax=Ideonella sp. B508-1 TaxID=137716 RepID=UPI0011D20911|nr:MarR family transcriptional regulator [Ideonella sp. B508-1]